VAQRGAHGPGHVPRRARRAELHCSSRRSSGDRYRHEELHGVREQQLGYRDEDPGIAVAVRGAESPPAAARVPGVAGRGGAKAAGGEEQRLDAGCCGGEGRQWTVQDDRRGAEVGEEEEREEILGVREGRELRGEHRFG